MALAYFPPPHPTLPENTRYPDNTQEPGAPFQLGETQGVYIYGRDGQQPDAELATWISEALNFAPAEDHPFGSWIDTNGWCNWQDADTHGVVVTVELRTPEEVADAAGDQHGETPFAVTGMAGTAGFPPLDGLDGDGETFDSFFTTNPSRWPAPHIRILIREDLASGGAGDRWAGRAFFVESVMHEMAHASMLTLSLLYSPDFVRDNLCDIFNRPSSRWDDPDLPWEHRVVEGAAEVYKDIVFPGRKFRNRTRLGITRGRFEDFKELMFRLLENPYWAAWNRSDLRVREDTFFFNLGISSYVHQPSTVRLAFVNEDVHPNIGGFTDRQSPREYRWPFVGSFRLGWNFDPNEGGPADPGDGLRWGDLDEDGFPVYNFERDAWSGEPANRVRIQLTVDFYDLDTTFSTTGDYYGSVRAELWPAADDPDPDHFIPPISGFLEIDFNDVEFAPGVTALPAGGFSAWPRMGSSLETHPKYTLYPSETIAFEPVGLSYLWPWVEIEGEHIVVPLRQMPWPYKDGKVALGTPRPAVHKVPHRVVGQTTGRQTAITVTQRTPDTTLEGDQSLGMADVVGVVTTAELPDVGEVKVVAATRSIVLAYGSTTDTTLEDVSYLSGHQGDYPDGARVYEH